MSRRDTRRAAEAAPSGRRWRRIVLGAVVLGAIGSGAVWVWDGRDAGSTATPRLGVDRTDVDLGYRRFDSPARAEFLLTNAGDAPLRLREVPRVRVVAGC